MHGETEEVSWTYVRQALTSWQTYLAVLYYFGGKSIAYQRCVTPANSVLYSGRAPLRHLLDLPDVSPKSLLHRRTVRLTSLLCAAA